MLGMISLVFKKEVVGMKAHDDSPVSLVVDDLICLFVWLLIRS